MLGFIAFSEALGWVLAMKMLELFRRALRLSRGRPAPSELALDSGRYQRFRELLRRATVEVLSPPQGNTLVDCNSLLKSEPDDLWLHRLRAYCLDLADDDTEGALKELTLICSSEDALARDYVDRAWLYLRLSKTDDARRDFDRAMKMAPTNHEVWCHIAEGFRQLEDFDAARDSVLVAVSVAPNDCGLFVLGRLGFISAVLGNLRLAVHYYDLDSARSDCPTGTWNQNLLWLLELAPSSESCDTGRALRIAHEVIRDSKHLPWSTIAGAAAVLALNGDFSSAGTAVAAAKQGLLAMGGCDSLYRGLNEWDRLFSEGTTLKLLELIAKKPWWRALLEIPIGGFRMWKEDWLPPVKSTRGSHDLSGIVFEEQ